MSALALENETTTGVTATRDRLARYMMIALGVATLGAFANAAHEFSALPPDRLVVNTWQMLGFVVFAGLFTLLGFFPRRMTGIWELVLFHKLAVTLFNASFIGTVTGPVRSDNPLVVTVVDGVLVVVTLMAYVLTRGWRAWSHGR
ncbi:hypothetical protein F0U62_10250 [Cystobacter fuscus]|nr:hypothetical protein F0U62_10250 [Cystobacter fuscus]